MLTRKTTKKLKNDWKKTRNYQSKEGDKSEENDNER